MREFILFSIFSKFGMNTDIFLGDCNSITIWENAKQRKITYLVRFHTVQSILKISRFRLDLCFEICVSIASAIRGQWYILACEFWTVRSADFGSSECNFWYDFLYYSHFVKLTVHLVHVFLVPNNSLYTFLTERSIQVLHVFYISNLVAVKN